MSEQIQLFDLPAAPPPAPEVPPASSSTPTERAGGPVCMGCVFPPIAGCGKPRREASDGRDPRLRWCCDACAVLAAQQVPGMVGPGGLRTLLPVDAPRRR